MSSPVKGILFNRERPITAGWCGDDNCKHKTHIDRRRAQDAADKRKANREKKGSE